MIDSENQMWYTEKYSPLPQLLKPVIVTLSHKRDLEDVIKALDEIILDYPGMPSVIITVLR